MANRLFVEARVIGDSALIGNGDIDMQFYNYCKGYKRTADALVDKCLHEGLLHQNNQFVFPIVFLYRQYFELMIKYFYLSFSDDDKTEKRSKIKGHDISNKLDQIFKPTMQKHTCLVDEGLDDLEEYAKEFEEYDKGSDAFRYPINKTMDIYHEKMMRIDLEILKEGMLKIDIIFDSIRTHLEVDKGVKSRLN